MPFPLGLATMETQCEEDWVVEDLPEDVEESPAALLRAKTLELPGVGPSTSELAKNLASVLDDASNGATVDCSAAAAAAAGFSGLAT